MLRCNWGGPGEGAGRGGVSSSGRWVEVFHSVKAARKDLETNQAKVHAGMSEGW